MGQAVEDVYLGPGSENQVDPAFGRPLSTRRANELLLSLGQP
ncbi:hypothetical protein [Streptomyces parvus]